MDNRVIHVPVSVLLHPKMLASAKIVWAALRLHPDAGPGALEARTRLSRHPVLRSLSHLKALTRPPAGTRVQLPTALLADRAVGAQAKVLYGLLQTVPGFRHHRGEFTYTALSTLTHLGPNTLKRAIGELTAARWLRVTQRTRLSPIKFTLGTPELNRALAEAAAARPGFLVNPQTGERLELDRFYPPDVGFEYHGTQHDRATERYTQEESDAQHFRDLIKAGICLYRDVQLVIVRAEDLSVEGMLKKIGQRLPLREITGREALVDVLEDESLTYRAAVGAQRA